MRSPFEGEPGQMPSIGRANSEGSPTTGNASEIAKIDYLLAEINTWSDLLPAGILGQLRQRYVEREDLLLGNIQAPARERQDPSPSGTGKDE